METVFRVAIIYILVIVGLRVMGKREFSQLTSIELVALLLIPELVAQAMIREDFSLTNAIIALSTLFSLVFINSLLSHRFQKFEKLITGSPTVIVANGEFKEAAMHKERISPGEVFSEMHKSGLERLDQVKWAILEGDGKISIIPQDINLPVGVVKNEKQPSV